MTDINNITELTIHDLPPDRRKVVEAGLITFAQTHAEKDDARRELAHVRDQLERQLAVAQDEIHRQAQDIDHLKSLNTLWESRIQSAVAERDHAVAEKLEYQILLKHIVELLAAHNFRIEKGTAQ